MRAMSTPPVGSVIALRRYPVKSMLGEDLASAVVGPGGVAGDRAYALVDDESGKVVSAKRPRHWARMFDLTASTGADGHVEIAFPGAGSVKVDAPEVAPRLSEFFGRDVSVASAPPAGAAYDEEWVRELKGDVAPYFGMPTRTEDGDELIDGGGFMSAQGNFFDFGAVHLLTTGTLRRLSELAPGSRFDARRFRPNVVVETRDDGFVETAWQGRTLVIGEVRLAVSFTVPRCVMTTLAQGDLPADRDVLRSITRHNAVDAIATGTPYPCAGVYADVVDGGEIRVGDTVALTVL
jgi:uncharacterized protein YcbX